MSAAKSSSGFWSQYVSGCRCVQGYTAVVASSDIICSVDSLVLEYIFQCF